MWWMIGIAIASYVICDLLDEGEDRSHIIAFVKRFRT